MLVQSFSKVFILVNYQVNKNYIAEFLCINKAKPELQCQGHCYLKKSLQKADQAGSQTTNQHLKTASEITLFYQDFFSCPLIPAPDKSELTSNYKPGIFIQTSTAVFHPPQFTI